MNDITKGVVAQLGPVIAVAARQAIKDTPVLAVGDAHEVAAQVTKEVAAVVVNQTNNEPWYQSRVTWGAIIAGAAGIAGLAGYKFDSTDQATIVNLVVSALSLVGGAVAWYGRWIAKKPIGA